MDGGESRRTISRRFSTAVSWPDSLFALGNPFASGSAFALGKPFRAERPIPDGTVIAESLGSAEVARDCTAGTPVFEGKEFRSGRSLAAAVRWQRIGEFARRGPLPRDGTFAAHPFTTHTVADHTVVAHISTAHTIAARRRRTSFGRWTSENLMAESRRTRLRG